MYIPCSSLTASVHTLQLAHCQCTYLAARSLPVYKPCSSLTASVHTLHVNKKYTRRPHERSTVQFIGHVDLVYRSSTLPHRINPKLLWVLSVHAISTPRVESRVLPTDYHVTELHAAYSVSWLMHFIFLVGSRVRVKRASWLKGYFIAYSYK